MSEEIEYPSKERERAKVNVKVSAEVNTYLHDLYNQIQYEFCEQYEDEIKDLQQKVEQLEKENISLKEANNYHQEVIKSMKEPENVHHYHLENIKLRARNKQLENIRKEIKEYLTSYESISTIQGLNDIEKNKILDEKTMNEMVNRYLKVHDILLNILNKGSESNV